MSSRTIDILSAVVASLGQNIPINATAILTSTTQKIWIEERFWAGLYFKVGDSITADAVSYVIASIEDCDYIVVTTEEDADLISATGNINLRVPQFINGPIDMASSEVVSLANPAIQDVTPLIYMVEPYRDQLFYNPKSSIVETSEIRLFFLEDADDSVTVDQYYDNQLRALEKVFNAFFSALLLHSSVEKNSLQEESASGYTYIKPVFNKVKAEPGDKQIFPFHFTGFEKTFSLSLVGSCCDNLAAFGECPTFEHQMEVNTAATIATVIQTLPEATQEAIETAICTPIPALSSYTAQELIDGLTQAQKNQIFPIIPLKTFQLTSAYSGDDGETELGRGGSTVLLLPNGLLNPYASNNRFTDAAGRNPFVDDFRIDWLNGLMWHKTLNRPVMTLANALADAAASTLGGYTDWRIPNENEFFSIRNQEGHFAGGLNNPFSYGVFGQNGGLYWTSTSENVFNGGLIMNSEGRIEPAVITNTYHVPLVRTL